MSRAKRAPEEAQKRSHIEAISKPFEPIRAVLEAKRGLIERK